MPVRVAPWVLPDAVDATGPTASVSDPQDSSNESNYNRSSALVPGFSPSLGDRSPQRQQLRAPPKQVSWSDDHASRPLDQVVREAAPHPSSASASATGDQPGEAAQPLPTGQPSSGLDSSSSDLLPFSAAEAPSAPNPATAHGRGADVSDDHNAIPPGGTFDDIRANAFSRLQAAVEDCYNSFAVGTDGGLPFEVELDHASGYMGAAHRAIGVAAKTAGESSLPTPAFVHDSPEDSDCDSHDDRHASLNHWNSSVPYGDTTGNSHLTTSARSRTIQTANPVPPRLPANTMAQMAPILDTILPPSVAIISVPSRTSPVHDALGSGVTTDSLDRASDLLAGHTRTGSCLQTCGLVTTNPIDKGAVCSNSFVGITRSSIDPVGPTPQCADDVSNADNLRRREAVPDGLSGLGEEPPLLSRQDLKKIHLQLKHGTITAVRDYVRSAGMWHANMYDVVQSIITDCGCRLGDPPTTHPKVATRPPTDSSQEAS